MTINFDTLKASLVRRNLERHNGTVTDRKMVRAGDHRRGVTWYIANNQGAVACEVDSDCLYVTFRDCDMTGAFLNAFSQDNNFGATAPDRTKLINCTSGGTIANCYVVNAGKRIEFNGCELQQPVGNSATNTAMLVNSTFAGDVKVINCDIANGFDFGIRLSYSTTLGSALVSQNPVHGCSVAGVRVSGGVKNFSITNNDLGASSTFGGNGKAVEILTGASDNYTVAVNRVAGSTIGVNDNTTGSPNRYVAGNV